MKDNEYSLALVDPPYGIGAGGIGFKSGTRFQSDFHKVNDWDLVIPNKEYFGELFRISKNQIIWGSNYMTKYLNTSKGWIFWDKRTGNNSYGDGELAWTSFDIPIKKFTKYWSGANAKEKEQLDRIHPTQKPIALYKWLLKNYAKEGDTILDTHVGSGSSRIACWEMGFDFTGYEIDKDYWKAQEKRFNIVKNQMKLW